MSALFSIHAGLMIWTAVTFAILVFLLGRFGWGPLVKALEEREEALKAERVAAEKARAEAQRLESDLSAKLAQIEARAQEALSKAAAEADALRARQTAEAQAEAARLLDKARAEMQEEKRRLVAELRRETASLAVQAAERLVKKSVDEGVKKSVLDQFFADLDAKKKSGPAGGARTGAQGR